MEGNRTFARPMAFLRSFVSSTNNRDFLLELRRVARTAGAPHTQHPASRGPGEFALWKYAALALEPFKHATPFSRLVAPHTHHPFSDLYVAAAFPPKRGNTAGFVLRPSKVAGSTRESDTIDSRMHEMRGARANEHFIGTRGHRLVVPLQLPS
jgi:hypothetical protein